MKEEKEGRSKEEKSRRGNEEGREERKKEGKKGEKEKFSRPHFWSLVTRFEVRPGNLNC